ncbi:MAG TPA: sterol desaturase family protein [Bacteroidia bacterium]|jgi:beta-carotene 3-hydroxylase|nr:sterol desaturase family protein [Bacteroidia bacterium]
MFTVIGIVTSLIAFIAMEGVAWFTHKYIMHGLFWNLHQDHHSPNQHSVLEKNDSFFLFFAVPGILGLLVGVQNDFNLYFWAGLGITLYGFAYFFIHDIFIHQRIKLFRNSNWIYFRALRKAHKVHHKHLGKEDGECFGMLLVPLKYFKEAANVK